MEAPFLARDEERGLAVSWKDKGDERALHRLISAHMRLVIALAGRFRHYGLPMADLVQEGHVGLMEAAARFEPEREVRFSTYATWWIRASIQDYILRNWSIVRGGTSSAQKALFFNLRRLRARLMQSTEEQVGSEIHSRIAIAIGVSTKDVALMDARLSGPDMSLNAPVGEESEASSERMDFLVDGAALPDETVTATVDGERRLSWLKQALTVLSERELRILRERRLAEDQATLEALGHRLGISKERVRQIENRALEKLRRALADRFPNSANNIYA
ncbi:RNA polymerase factor sigma-32 [Methylobacterium haplocladii]|uniref:RNA polymerase factor sigma-32 n=2 Tax=Methylobacterium haplocladii TaxID=1176176 RepID=A0A512IPR7_9HYPH|nr:RNA polymerase factor sigma-32 [Methylobacterium haplocladii]GJD84675.1 RNA polymerase sigma factor RpoH [Methylobacterium haplocladii]GLS61200.1 RNA polymerase factor sigma-32 [Methylobacterium haplocladii]